MLAQVGSKLGQVASMMLQNPPWLQVDLRLAICYRASGLPSRQTIETALGQTRAKASQEQKRTKGQNGPGAKIGLGPKWTSGQNWPRAKTDLGPKQAKAKMGLGPKWA